MKPFSAVGDFWRPDDASRTVSGRLTFDGVSIELHLFDSLTPIEVPVGGVEFGPPRIETHSRLYGRLHETTGTTLENDRHVTLIDVRGVVMRIPAAELWQRWDVDTIVLGAHTRDETTTRGSLYFDALQAWASPPMLVTTVDHASGTFTTGTSEIVMHEAIEADVTYRLVASAEGSWGLNVQLDRRTSIKVDAPRPIEFSNVHSEWARPLHDLLIVCIGAPVALNEIRVEVSSLYGHTKMAALVFGAFQDTTERQLTSSKLREPGTSALLFPDDLAKYSEFLPEWLDLRRDLSAVVDQLTSVFYAPTMYSYNRYANIFKAAEELSKKCFDTSDLPKEEHKERVKLIVEAAREASVSEPQVEWAERVLQARNDSPLHVLISKLIEDAGAAGAAIDSAVPKAGRKMAAARTATSHGGMVTDPIEQHWFGTLLLFLLRLHLLREIGLPPSVIEQRVLAARQFQNAINVLHARLS